MTQKKFAMPASVLVAQGVRGANAIDATDPPASCGIRSRPWNPSAISVQAVPQEVARFHGFRFRTARGLRQRFFLIKEQRLFYPVNPADPRKTRVAQ